MAGCRELMNQIKMCTAKYAVFSKNCKNDAQKKALFHVKENFLPEGIKSLRLIKDGVRLTDCTGAVADFRYDAASDRIIFKEVAVR